jgi:hypothetical protein
MFSCDMADTCCHHSLFAESHGADVHPYTHITLCSLSLMELMSILTLTLLFLR